MTENDIYQKIESVYKTEKGKNFISHLIRAFFPADKATFMFGFEEDKKREMKCCITGEKVYTKDDLFQLIHSQTTDGKQIFFERLMLTAKAALGETKEPSEELLKFEEESLLIKQNLAVISEKSDKILSQLAWRALFNFTSNELLRGNGHINWLLSQERSKSLINEGRAKGWIENKKEERIVEKVVNHSRLSLSENETLQKLKEKMEKQ